MARILHLYMQPAAEHGDVLNPGLALQHRHAAQQIRRFQIQQMPLAERAISAPPAIRAR